MQKVHGDHAGFVLLGNLAEQMFCGVRSVFDGVRGIHFSRCTVRVQAKLDGMSLPPPCTASYPLVGALSFQICWHKGAKIFVMLRKDVRSDLQVRTVLLYTVTLIFCRPYILFRQ